MLKFEAQWKFFTYESSKIKLKLNLWKAASLKCFLCV
jgi:hypothetical protein